MFRVILVLCLVALEVQGCPTGCSCFSGIVDCANRGLSEFPTGVPPDSLELFLQGNDLKELKGSHFTGLDQLQYVYLQNNAIATIEAATFAPSASTLVTLDLHGNEVTELPAGVFAGMTTLKVLNLNQNKVKVIGADLFADLVVATQISFYDNLVETLHPEAFGNISALWYLGMANNKLTSIPDDLGSQFPDLYSIDYSGNQLETLPVVPATVVQLYLNDNRISKIHTGALGGATELHEVFLANNEVSAIEDHSFHGADNLAWLDLADNRISEVNDHMFMYTTFTGLYLNGNDLGSVTPNAFQSSKSSLTRLRLDDNDLSDLDATVLSQLSNNDLTIWLGGNPWQCDCDLQDLALYIDDNEARINDLDSALCSPGGVPLSEFGFVALCSEENLALIISLPIVGAILLFLVVSYFVYRSSSNNNKLSVATDNDYAEIESVGKEYKNAAYDYDTGF